MFQKLRLQFIVINLAIIFLLFVVLTSGAYFFVRQDMVKRWSMFIERPPKPPVELMQKEGPPPHPMDFAKKSEQPPVPLPEKNLLDKDELPEGMMRKDTPFPMHFYGKTDGQGKVTTVSRNSPVELQNFQEGVTKILQATETADIVDIGDNSYFYYKRPLKDQSGMFIIFREMDHEKELLRILVLTLVIIGMVCFLLSLAGSLFMSRKALEPVKKAWQQQRDFLADASHELRTPLAVIQTNLEIVADNKEETVASQEKWLNNIKEETTYMIQMVNSLLFLARADAHQQLMDKREFSLDTAVAQMTEQFRPMADQKGIRLEMDIPRPVAFCGDEMRLKQVVGILLDNGLRHTPAGGQVSVLLERIGSEVVLKVADTGEGIDPEHTEKIFDRFYQVDKARSKGGAGLGLAIAKWIVENHMGRIQVESQLGKGTVFTVIFSCHVG